MFGNKQTFQKKDTTLIYTLNIYQLCKFGEHGKESFHIDFAIIKKKKLKTKAQYILELRMWLFDVCQGRILWITVGVNSWEFYLIAKMCN